MIGAIVAWIVVLLFVLWLIWQFLGDNDDKR